VGEGTEAACAAGLLLSISLLTAVIVLTAALLAIWETFLGAKWLGHFW
jgi:hypothetical protein